MTHLCVPIFVNDIGQAQRDIALAVEAGADLVELRMDHQDDAATTRQVISSFDVRFILTCRAAWEGGQSELGDEARVRLLTEVVPTDDTVFLDIELETIRRVGAAGVENPIITSAHDFTGRPDRLYSLIEEMNQSVGRVNKIVWLARSIRDNIEAFELLQHGQKPTIALCMGEAGLLSRVLAKKFGAFLTFASLTRDGGTAPGQVSIADMKRLYRWDAINPRTRVYGVVGSPIMHSMSPAIHNASFEAVGHDGVYLPMLVQPGYESFKAFMETFLAFAPLDLAGLSVTIPHKENALRWLTERGADVEPLAQSIGAVNTITIDRNGAEPALRGINSDYAAILDTITSALQIRRDDLKDRRVAVIGAGGTGRTAVAALANCGATVVVYNRTRERADELAREFNGQTDKVVSADLGKLCDSCCEIYVNTTSVGMHPNVDQSPFGDRLPKLTSSTLVFDTIYNPIRTKLLRDAEQAGATTVGGIEMFVRQAARQFESWTQQAAPVDLMRRIVLEKLG